jgi:leukotriene-A4 hydrolase
MPPVDNAYDTSLAAAADALAVKWHTADVMGVGGAPPEGASASDIASFSSEQTAAFLARLNELRSATPMSPKLTRAMAELYGFDAAANAEIKCEWLRLCVLAGDDAALPAASSFLKSVGRMKYLRPLYRALLRSRGQPAAKDVARATLAAAKKGYHPIAAKMVAADLGELAE